MDLVFGISLSRSGISVCTKSGQGEEDLGEKLGNCPIDRAYHVESRSQTSRHSKVMSGTGIRFLWGLCKSLAGSLQPLKSCHGTEIKVVTVVGFPLGATTTGVKAGEAQKLLLMELRKWIW